MIISACVLLVAACRAGMADGQPRISIPDLWINVSVDPQTVIISRQDQYRRLTYTITLGNSGDPATLQGVELRFYHYDQQYVYSYDGGGDFACRSVDKPYPSTGPWYISCISGNFPTTATIRVVTLPVLPGPIVSVAWIDPNNVVVERTKTNNAATALAFAVP
jgi:hypothetical protein